MSKIRSASSIVPLPPPAARKTGGVLAIIVAVLLVAVLGVVSGPVHAARSPTTPPVVKFASLPHPTAVAVTPHQLVALSAASCSKVYSIAPNGTVRTFATLVTAVTRCTEAAVAVSPGLGNFAPGEVFVLLAGRLYEVPANGSSSPVAASMTLKNLTGGNMGLAFDYVGGFGYALLATGGVHGYAVEIDAANEVRTIGSFGSNVEGPSVAPTGFGAIGGDLVVANSYNSSVFTMSPAGTVRTFGAYGAPAQSVAFVPTVACSYSTTGDSYFVAATSANALLAVPSSAFAQLAGSGLVLGEARGAGAAVLHPNGSTSSFLRIAGHLEGAAYVACPIGITKTVNLASHGLNSTSLDLIGYDPATQELVGVDRTNAPSQIFLLNGSTVAFVRNVSTGMDPSAVAYDPLTDTLYVANTGSNNLTILNASTFQELGNVSTGAGSAPVGLAYDSANSKLYVADSGNDTVLVFSVANNQFVNQAIALPGEPLGLVANPLDGNVYAVGNVAGNGTVWDIHAFKVIQNLTVGRDAHSIAVNGSGGLYVTLFGSNEVAIIALGTTTTIALPQPLNVAYDPANGLIFVDRADGNLSVLQGSSILASYFFGANPGTLVYDPAAQLVFGAADVTVFGLDPRIIIGGSG